MKLKTTAAVLSAAALFAACSDEVVNVNDEAKEKATFTMKVIDGITGEVIPGAQVYSVMDEDTEEADSLGIVTWKKNAIGDYLYYVSADTLGYKTVQITMSATEGGAGDVARVADVYKEVLMFKGGVNASGTVLYTDIKTGKRGPVEGAKVIANCGLQFIPAEVTTETDKDGAYEFKDLPAGVNCNISVGQMEINDVLYSGSTVKASGARPGDIDNADFINLAPVTPQFEMITDNFDAIDTTTSLQITFSAAVAKDSLLNKWSVTKGGTEVAIKVEVVDGKTVKITPFSKKWEKGESYSVSGTAYSEFGKPESFDESFTVGAKGGKVPGQVSKLKAEQDDEYIDLTWTAPKGGISGYVIFYKTNLMADFERGGYADELDESYSFSTSSFSAKVTKVSFIVLPYNGEGRADMNKAESVEVKYEAPDEI